MIATLLFAVQLPSQPPTAPGMNSYMACVIAGAQRLLPSREPAEAIARAAVFGCQEKLSLAAHDVDKSSNEVLRAGGSPTTQPGQIRTSDDLKPMIKALAIEAALTAVVEARLKAPLR